MLSRKIQSAISEIENVERKRTTASYPDVDVFRMENINKTNSKRHMVQSSCVTNVDCCFKTNHK